MSPIRPRRPERHRAKRRLDLHSADLRRFFRRRCDWDAHAEAL